MKRDDKVRLNSDRAEEISDIVQANEAMNDAFYGNGEKDERDLPSAAEVYRNPS